MKEADLPAGAKLVGRFGKDRFWEGPGDRVFMEVNGDIREGKPLKPTPVKEMLARVLAAAGQRETGE